MKIYTKYATNNECYKAGKKLKNKWFGILVHSTGANNNTLKRYVNYPEVCGVNPYGNHWDVPRPAGCQMCVHSFLGLDINKEVAVVEILPRNYICWGCGGSYNYDPTAHFQFEICEGSTTDTAYFNKAYAATVEYCVSLCKAFGLNETNICSHKEAGLKGYASGHGDPESYFKYFGKTMKDLRADVKKKLNPTVPTPVAPTKAIIKSKQPCSYFYQSIGICAKRDYPDRNASVVKERCTKNGYYPIKYIVTMSDGSKWLEHADTGLFTALNDTDGSKLFNATKTVFVKMGATDNLNIRSAASTSASKVGMLKFGENVYAFKGNEKIANGYTWIKIMYDNGFTGWVAKKYLK